MSNLPFIFNISFVLLHIEMLLSGTMNVVEFLFIREEWRFYVGALFFSSGRALRTQTSSTSTFITATPLVGTIRTLTRITGIVG